VAGKGEHPSGPDEQPVGQQGEQQQDGRMGVAPLRANKNGAGRVARAVG